MKQDPAAPTLPRAAHGGTSFAAGFRAGASADMAPVIEKLAQVVENPRVHSWALTGLWVLAALSALHVAREMVLPIVMAFILSLVFAPAVRALKKLRVPESLGAALVVVSLLGAVVAGGYTLSEPAAQWLDKAPEGIRKIGAKLRRIAGQVRDVSKATEQVQKMTIDITAGSSSGPSPPQEVTVKTTTGTAGVVFGMAQEFALSALSMLVLLYFMLASGDLFLRTLVASIPRLADKKRAVEMSQQIESEISTYLFTVTLLNAALGAAVGLALFWLGVPNPMLWGVMVSLFNFIPYLGVIASLTVLTIVGLLTFDELWRGLLVPGVYYALNSAENMLITPLILGRRLHLNPVLIVLSVLFWGWMWGILGALLAVPILVVLKIFYERLNPLPVPVPAAEAAADT